MEQVPVNMGDPDYDPLFSYEHGLDSFPAPGPETGLVTLAATSNDEGSKIFLKLSGEIDLMNVLPGNFRISFDNLEMPGLVSEVGIPVYDSSMIEISLSQNIPGENTLLTLSFSGGEIQSISGTLREFSNLFIFNNFKNYGTPLAVPGRIEAEDYFEMSGIDTENCTDQGGGLNVGWIDPGDWMKYYLEIQTTGLYRITGRISGYNQGTLSLVFNDTVSSSINFSSTDGWQSWADFQTPLYLHRGKYVMKAMASSNAYNINYFDFELFSTSIDEVPAGIDEIILFPNPVGSYFTLRVKSEIIQPVSIKIFDMQGRFIRELYKGPLDYGLNSFSFDADQSMAEGIYFIEIKSQTGRHFKKLVKK
jgi:hypothetical protein